MQVGDLVELTGGAVCHPGLRHGTFFAVVVDILQEVDEGGYVKDPDDWAYTVSWAHLPALHRRVFECEVEKLS